MKITNINVLPVACVGLLMVIMMIMVAPMVISYSKTPVDVPQANTAERKVENEIVISLTKEKKLYLNDIPISLDILKEEIEDELKEDPYRLVVIRADKDVNYGEVISLIAIAKEAGAKRIACSTKKRERNE
ncbi:MAG: biopolymer transporter ExbD [candidate division WOR-3 bacterium]